MSETFRGRRLGGRRSRTAGPGGALAVLAVLALLVTACSDSTVAPDADEQLTREVLQLVSDSNLPGIDGATLADPIVVRLTDEAGNPVAQAPVRFTSKSRQLQYDGPVQKVKESFV